MFISRLCSFWRVSFGVSRFFMYALSFLSGRTGIASPVNKYFCSGMYIEMLSGLWPGVWIISSFVPFARMVSLSLSGMWIAGFFRVVLKYFENVFLRVGSLRASFADSCIMIFAFLKRWLPPMWSMWVWVLIMQVMLSGVMSNAFRAFFIRVAWWPVVVSMSKVLFIM